MKGGKEACCKEIDPPSKHETMEQGGMVEETLKIYRKSILSRGMNEGRIAFS